ncbi:MAG: DUF4271 domain-containing protein [Flavobacteriales bacterium]|nr:DUF4271 domain-containing protein [Flavobacteriales bacterium]
MIEISRVYNIDDALFFMLLLSAMLVALLRYVYPRLFLRDVVGGFRLGDATVDESLARSSRGEMTYAVLCSMLYVYMVSIVVYMWWSKNRVGYSFDVADWGVVYGIGLVGLIVKWGLDKFLLYVFDVGDMAMAFAERKVTMRLFMSVWGGLAFFVMWYATGGFTMIVTDVGVGIMIAVWVIIFILFMAEFLMRSKSYFLFFIFYLCTIQICPMILAWIWIKNVLTT